MTDYKVIRVYIREAARYEGRPLAHAIVSQVHSLGTAARCVVLRGIEGLYENGETVSAAIVEGPADLPLVIDILVPTPEAEDLVARLETMVTDGFVTVSGATVTSFRTPSGPLPAHLLVRDIMTVSPIAAHGDFSVRAAVELLLDRKLKCLPVVDGTGAPIGILTQGDLVARAAMPVRLGLLDTLAPPIREDWLRSMETRAVADIMTVRPKNLRDDQKAVFAVRLMARSKMKRLPVVDANDRLVGMLSRIDVLRALLSHRGEAPAQQDEARSVAKAAFARDIMKRDNLALSADSALRDALSTLARDQLQRAAVVDGSGRLVGIVDDRALIEALDHEESAGAKILHSLAPRSGARISDIMLRDPVRAREDLGLSEVLKLMTERGLKRIPVVDDAGRFTGMLRRDEILLALAGN